MWFMHGPWICAWGLFPCGIPWRECERQGVHIKDFWVEEKHFQGRKSARQGEFAAGASLDVKKSRERWSSRGRSGSWDCSGSTPSSDCTTAVLPSSLPGSLAPSLPPCLPPIPRHCRAAPGPGAESLQGLLCPQSPTRSFCLSFSR